MITETGQPEDFKRTVLDVKTITFGCGMRYTPNFCPDVDHLSGYCGMDDCETCNTSIREGKKLWESYMLTNHGLRLRDDTGDRHVRRV